jgi:sarcosine oxidase subunit beta
MGVPSRLIGSAEAQRLCPYLAEADVAAAVWSPGDGFARPRDVVHGYADAAVALGAEIRTHPRDRPNRARWSP